MKIFFYIFITFNIILITACTTVKEKTLPQRQSFETIESNAKNLEKEQKYSEEESFLRLQLIHKWSEKELSAIHYYLGKSLYLQKKYDKAVKLLPVSDIKLPFFKERMILAADAFFKIQKYSDSLDALLRVYLFLDKNEKIDASKKVLLSYVYLERWDDASKWYKNLNNEKRENAKKDLIEIIKENPEKQTLFFDDITSYGSEQQTYETPEIEEKDYMKSIVDNYSPDWSRIAILLPTEENWQKVAELEETFFKWYFSSKLNGIEIDVYRYMNGKEIVKAFEEASSKKTAIIIGAVFYDCFAKNIAEASAKYSIPVISYTSYISTPDKPLFINLKHTKKKEAADVISYLVQNNKKNFAIVYPENFDGITEKNIYWDAIIKSEGNIVNVFKYTPNDKDIYSSLEKLAPEPDNAGTYISKFRRENKDRFKTRTLMSRAIKSFKKNIPPNVDYDTLIIIGKPSDGILIINSLAYKNLELDYQSNFEQSRIKRKNRELSSQNLPWQHSIVKIVPGSEVLSSKTFLTGVDKFVDAMVLSSKIFDNSDKNTYLSNFKTFFTSKFSREPYLIEMYLAEIADFTVQAVSRAGSGNFTEYRAKIATSKFTSLLAGKEFTIAEDGAPVGLNAIYLGVKREGFVQKTETPKETEEKKKETDKITDSKK